jgi:thiol-disulfide isomerase/thioredoxin
MKKTLLILLIIVISQVSTGQTENSGESVTDPFCRMIRTVYSLDAVAFNSRNSMKQVFENDTIITYARVLVKKKGTAISFLQIIPEDEDDEMLFLNDSAWIVNHLTKKMSCIGTETEYLTYNYLSRFFPFSLYEVDTLISRTKPYWKVIDQTKEHVVVLMEINDSSEDVSDIRVEFTIGNSDFLPYGTLQESVYLKADKLFQEQVFSDYTFPDPDEIRVPEYYWTYEKDLSSIQATDSRDEDEDQAPGEVYLQNVELYDLSFEPMRLPDNGLIFIDLWYIGCAPCMKSAPVIEKLYHEFKGKVHFFSVNEIDSDTAKINRFKDKMGITFPVLLGGKEKLAMKVNGRGGYPVFILMEAGSGKVLWKSVGYTENLEELITDAIDRNL